MWLLLLLLVYPTPMSACKPDRNKRTACVAMKLTGLSLVQFS